MIFHIHGKEYRRQTAVEIVRDLEREAGGYRRTDGALRQFLDWSLARLEAQIPARELALARRVSDETLAFSYLCLLDKYAVGRLTVEPAPPPDELSSP
jgi:predicted metal-dependent hydrolase